MKRILRIALAALVAFGALDALAEEAVQLGGVVVEVRESAVLIETAEYGDVLVNYDDATVLEGLEDGFQVGTYVIASCDGTMTRSVPPEIYAIKIAMYVVSGTVVEVSGMDALVDQGGENGLVLVHLQEGMPPLFVGCPVDAYYSGVMLLSYPGQVGALYVSTPTLAGEVTEVLDGYFLMTAEDGQEYLVNNCDGTVFDAAVSAGERVRVSYNGAAAKSMPPQIYAIAVFHVTQ